MNGIYLTLIEFEALRGESDLAVRLYLNLRFRVDLASRLVGLKTRLSYQALREDCERWTPRGHGYQRTQPSLKALRVALDSLIRAKLLEKRGDGLVFLMPLAATAAALASTTTPCPSENRAPQ